MLFAALVPCSLAPWVHCHPHFAQAATWEGHDVVEQSGKSRCELEFFVPKSDVEHTLLMWSGLYQVWDEAR